MSTKKQMVLDTLNRRKTGYIPVIPTATAFALENSSCDPEKAATDPETFAAANAEVRQKYQYDGSWSGDFQGVTEYLGGGLIDKHGKVSKSGDGTIQNPEDMKKLKSFNIANCPQLEREVAVIKALHKADPDEPVFTIMNNPSMVASALMDGENYYYHMKKNPGFIHELTEFVFEPLLQCAKVLLDAGTDILWLPMPTLGGTCISRGQYEEFCLKYNKRFNQFVLEQDSMLMLHTCGNWNDRFDLAVSEGAHGLHVAEADLAALKREYGNEECIMGQLPTVPVVVMSDAETVYKESLKECLTAAPGGGFILSPDCGMPGSTKGENVEAMVRAARDAEKQLAGNC